uniref:Uncharacterized protein n=1 Tax=Timema shepardi TaxID=629360 RepID=A0A7R9B4S9_TIMSH|nr:unnamed protein product [Timema shepardi]
MADHNPYRSYLKSLSVGGAEFKYYDLPALGQNYESLLCLTVQSALVSFSALAQAAPTTLPTAWTAPQSMFSEPSVTLSLLAILFGLPLLSPFLPPSATHVAGTLSYLPPQLPFPGLLPTSHRDSRCRDSVLPPTATPMLPGLPYPQPLDTWYRCLATNVTRRLDFE